MGIREIVAEKRQWRAQWRAHMARIHALPPDYRIVYDEMERYLDKVGPVSLTDGDLLAELLDFLEDGAVRGIGAAELIGPDVAAFADDLIGDSPTFADLLRESIRRESGEA